MVKVLAEDKPFNRNLITKSYGIYNLMEETFHSAKEGIQSSLYESLMKEGISSLREEFHRIIDNTRSELFQDNLDDAPALEFQENNQKDYVNFGFEKNNNSNNFNLYNRNQKFSGWNNNYGNNNEDLYDDFGYNHNLFDNFWNNNNCYNEFDNTQKIILDNNYYNEFDEPIKINSQYNNNYYNEFDDPLKTNFQCNNNYLFNNNLKIVNAKFNLKKFILYVKEFCEKIAINK
jgi:hypothetical protein